MEWDGEDKVDMWRLMKGRDHQVGQGTCKGELPLVFEETDRLLERRLIRIQGPRLGVGWWLQATGATMMKWTVKE